MSQKIETVKIPYKQLVREPNRNGLCYSAPGMVRKLPKGLIAVDYDAAAKLVELEREDGDRAWFPLDMLFGKVITEATDIRILYPSGNTDSLSIAGIECIKIKRTHYAKLIFESDLPF